MAQLNEALLSLSTCKYNYQFRGSVTLKPHPNSKLIILVVLLKLTSNKMQLYPTTFKTWVTLVSAGSNKSK